MISNGPGIIVGLGNPGSAYAKTRHNVGHMVVSELARRVGSSLSAHKKSGMEIATGRLVGQPVVVGRTRSYMNVSGGPVKALASFYSVPPASLIVVHDELDVDFGAIRLKLGGGEGGHNGLRSISQAFGTKDYLRVRVGIGRPPGRQDPADYVLKPFSTTERGELDIVVADAADAVELLLSHGLETAQNQVHAR